MRKAVLISWLLVLFLLGYYLVVNNINLTLADLPGVLHLQIKKTGSLAVIVFILATAIRPLLLLPSSIMIVAGGLAFGINGMAYSFVGELLAGALAFYLARLVGHDFINSHTGQKFKHFEHKLENHSFKSILFLKLMLFVPNDLISYAAGASNIKIFPFMAASTLGSMPIIVLYNFVAQGVTDVRYLLMPSLVIVLSVIFGKTIRYEYKKHQKKKLKIIADLGETDQK